MDAGSGPVDYCTLWPDQLLGVDYGYCCQLHDLNYSVGLPKLEADLLLAQCVAHEGLPLIGVVMFIGVTLFGWLFYHKVSDARR